jgi:DNA invertase Pin-like site-specific DNA recombinase
MATGENSINHKYGYIRVSSKFREFNSSIESQKKELIRQGIQEKNLRVEIRSAADAIKNLHVFQKLIEEELQENDLLMVTRIDRCNLNTPEFFKLQDNLFQRSITFIALDITHSNDLAVNKFIAATLSAITTSENGRRKELQRQGILVAKAAGKYKGRKTVLDKALISKVKDLKENSNLSITQIAKLTERSRATIYKLLKSELGYASDRLVKQGGNK